MLNCQALEVEGFFLYLVTAQHPARSDCISHVAVVLYNCHVHIHHRTGGSCIFVSTCTPYLSHQTTMRVISNFQCTK